MSADAPGRNAAGAGPPPLAGLRVLDVGTRITAPFCAGLLGELGADVIKVELPGAATSCAPSGPSWTPATTAPTRCGGRSRAGAGEGVDLDLRTPEGQDLFRRLAATADVVCENFRPGAMEKWHIGPDDLDPRLVCVRISVFGQDGPYSRRPGLDRLGIAYGGPAPPDRLTRPAPVRPGVTISDYLTGVFAAMAAVAGLYRRDAGARRPAVAAGAVIDAPLYGAVLRVLEWTLAGHDRLGTVRGREGNRLPNSAPLDNYPTADGAYVCIVAGSDANFGRLCRAMGPGRPADRPAVRHPGPAGRARRRDQRHRGRLDRRPAARPRSRRSASPTRSRWARPTAPPTSSPTPTWPPAATWSRWTTRWPGPIRQQAPFPRLVGQPTPVPTGAPGSARTTGRLVRPGGTVRRRVRGRTTERRPLT